MDQKQFDQFVDREEVLLSTGLEEVEITVDLWPGVDRNVVVTFKIYLMV